MLGWAALVAWAVIEGDQEGIAFRGFVLLAILCHLVAERSKPVPSSEP